MHGKNNNTYPPLLKTRRHAIVLAAGLFAAVLLTALFFATAEQYVSNVFPDCILRTSTGLKCFLCGGTRCARALFDGDIAKAFYYNPFVVLCGLGAVIWYVRLLACIFRKEYKPLRVSEKLLWAMLIGIVVFSAVRNFDFYQSVFY